MFGHVIVYILVGMFACSLVLPRVLTTIADVIHGYIGPATYSPSDFVDAKPQDWQGQGGLDVVRAPNESTSKRQAASVDLFSVSAPAGEISETPNEQRRNWPTTTKGNPPVLP